MPEPEKQPVDSIDAAANQELAEAIRKLAEAKRMPATSAKADRCEILQAQKVLLSRRRA